MLASGSDVKLCSGHLSSVGVIFEKREICISTSRGRTRGRVAQDFDSRDLSGRY